MRYSILFLLLLFAYKSVLAQDNSKITFSEEPDTLVKQRFIDRYENVFMTKVPGRHMFKIGLDFYHKDVFGFVSPEIQNITYGFGYEYKLFPAFSIGTNFSINGGWISDNKLNSSTVLQGAISGNVYGRWYYDMKRRIEEGKSANNFSGNFLALVTERRWEYRPHLFRLNQIGVEFGMQRRFLNYSRLEFAIGVYYQKFSNGYYVADALNSTGKVTDFEISTRSSLGMAFGDWKRTSNIPICEILYCDEFLGDQWKILWPILRLSNHMTNGTIGVAYEKKFGKSPLSVNAQVLTDYRRSRSDAIIASHAVTSMNYQIQPSLQLRYYFLQRRSIRKGTGGNNLSGLYFGPYFDYIKYVSKVWAESRSTNEHLGPGFSLGYQKTLFRRAYLDISCAQSWNLLKIPADRSKSVGSLRIGFGLAL